MGATKIGVQDWRAKPCRTHWIWTRCERLEIVGTNGSNSGNFENDYTERGHQEGAVHHFVRFLRGAVVEDPVILIILIPEESCQLSRVSVNHCEVQWSEVFIKWEILEIIINVEKEGIFVVLRWL